MKKIVYLIFSLLFILICGCNIPHPCCDVAQRWAGITALKNGVTWSPQYVNGIMTDLDSLKIAAMSGTVNSTTFNKTDTLNIKLSYTGTGTYNLTGSEVFYATFSNGATTQYNLDPTYNNQLKITSSQNLDDPATTVPNDIELKGTFDIRFIDPGNPSGISISNASFYAIIPQ